MITEVVVDGVGIIRQPNMWQIWSLKRVRGPNKWIAWYAAAACMTIKQFKKLPADKQEEVRRAYLALTSPHNVPLHSKPPEPAYRKGQHLSDEEKVELGRKLLGVKARLPRGHFGPWVAEKSGMTASMVQQYMRLAQVAVAGKP
jgi:hypothetical protein